MAGRGMWVGIGLGALVLGGAGVAAMVVKSERDSKKAGQAQAVEFGEKLAKVRTCLLGDAPLAADPAVAMELREITDPDGERALKDCATLASRLKRPEGPSSGSNAVESDWIALHKSVTLFRGALNWRVSDEPNKGIDGLRADVIAGLADVEGDYARLRSHAGLPPVVYLSGPEAPVSAMPAGLPVRIGGNDDVAPDEVTKIGDRLVITGSTGGGPALAVVERPARITAFYLGESAMRAGPPGADWGVWSDVPDEKTGELLLHAAPLGAGGDPVDTAGAGAVIARYRSPSPDVSASLTPYAAIGAGKDRAVVYSIELDAEEHWLAVSHDAGVTWTARRIAEGGSDVDVRFLGEHGRIDTTWRAADGAVWWFPLDAGRLAAASEPILIGVAEDEYDDQPVPCLAQTQIWWNTSSGVVRAPMAGSELTKVATERLGTTQLLCDDTAIVGLSTIEGQSVAIRCDAKGCQPGLRVPGADRDSIEWSIGPKHGLVAAAAAGGYLVLWRPGDKPPAGKARALFALPPNSTVRALVEWDGVLHAAITDEQRVTIVPLP